jgi:hypothetical protein
VRPVYIWNYNIKTFHKGRGCENVGWIHAALKKAKRRALVDVRQENLIIQREGDFLAS